MHNHYRRVFSETITRWQITGNASIPALRDSEIDTNQFMRALLEQNRLREEQMDKIISKLIDQKITTQASTSMLLIVTQTVPMLSGRNR